ncbi:MAG: TonB-dependent receptor [Acidobacteriota bacterium]
MSDRFKKVLLSLRGTALAGLFLMGMPAWVCGQTAQATLSGTVRDESGAVLQAAEIKLTEEATGLERATRTGRAGTFTLASLPPGRYRASASLVGFKTGVVRGILLSVGDKVTLEVVLPVGSLEETVSVDAGAQSVTFGTSQLGQVVGNRKIVLLPLNERDFLDLALLSPGAVPPAPGSRLSTQGNSGINVSGAREAANNFLLDGVDNNDLFLNRLVVKPSVDAIAEFKIQSSSYDAEYGRNGGSQVNVVVKSGTNAVHGSLFEFFRNSRLDAKNFFDLPDRKIPVFQRNQFGGSLGGPLSENRSFYFMNFEGSRTRRGETRTSNVPSLAERNGDFSGRSTPLRNPFTGQPFPGNRIPDSMIHPVGRAVAALYPLPNRDVVGQNFGDAPVGRERMTQFNLRVDHRATGAHQFFARYSFIDEFDRNPFAQKGPNIPRFGIQVLDRGQNMALGATSILGATALNDFRFGYNRLRREVFQENVGNSKAFSGLGLTGLNLSVRDYGFPSVVLAGYEKLGDDPNIPIVRRTGTFHVSDSLSRQAGRHFLKLGGELRYYQENGYNDLFARGQIHFQPAFTGDALGDLLLGFPVLSISAVNDNPQALRTTSYNGFLQDDWKIHPRLTLNLGVRYEFNSPPVDAQDRLVAFDVERGQLVAAGQEGLPRSGVESDKNNWAPRVGLSWDVNGTGKTVLRSGYGIYYDSGTLIENETLYFNPPYFQLSLFFTAPPNLLTLSDPFPAGRGLAPRPSPVTLDRRFRTAYSQQWSLGVQRELPGRSVLEAAYVGSKGTHLVMKRNLNQPVPGPGNINSRRPVAGFGDILMVSSDASSSFHSVQIRYEKELSRGVSVLTAYTYSKSLDNSSSFLESKGDDNTPQNSTNLRAERSLSNFDLRQRLSLSFTYDLPWVSEPGAGAGKLAGMLLRDWQITGIASAQSGRPFTPRLSVDNSNTGNVGGFFAHDRPNVIGDPTTSSRSPERFFNTQAFAMPSRFTFGNAGRNVLIGPGRAGLDLALLKNIRVTSGHSLQLRTELFNAFNHPNFDLPESFLDNAATFGRILSAGPARQIQFGLKYLF